MHVRVELMRQAPAAVNALPTVHWWSQAGFDPNQLIDVDAWRLAVFRRPPGHEWLMHDDTAEPACRI